MQNNTEEIWKTLDDYSDYSVSNYGNVRNHFTGNILKIASRKYNNVVYISDKQFTVHKLVAEYFVPNDNPTENTQIVHIDGDVRNNRADNLKWTKKIVKNYKIKKNIIKPILQYDKNMNLIKEWKNMKEIIENTNYGSSRLYTALTIEGKIAYDSIWKYKNENKKKVVIQDDEIFKPIGTFKDGTFSKYEASNYGNVRVIKRNKFLTPKNYVNCLTFVLYSDSDIVYNIPAHKLIAHLFVPRPEGKNCIEHIDGNMKNNVHTNLRWIYVFKPEKKKCEEIKYTDEELALELWLDIKGYKNYQVSNLGRVKNKKNGKLLKPKYAGSYTRVGLFFNNYQKNIKMHRLVANAFIYNPDPINKLIIDHIDNNKVNNRSSNLRWVTHKENSTYYTSEFKPEPIRPIIQYDFSMNIIKEWKNVKEIINENITYKYSTIISGINGYIPSAYGYIWKVKEEIKNGIILRNDEHHKNIGIVDGKDFSNYEITNHGNIYSNITQKYMSPSINDTGYMSINIEDRITKKRHHVQIHQLVAYVFINRNPPEGHIVNHLDENKLNNHKDNLEWMSIGDNNNYSIRKRLMHF